MRPSSAFNSETPVNINKKGVIQIEPPLDDYSFQDAVDNFPQVANKG
jgi:hypothetical protein